MFQSEIAECVLFFGRVAGAALLVFWADLTHEIDSNGLVADRVAHTGQCIRTTKRDAV